MNLQLLEDLCDGLLQSDCERSAILTALTDAELQDAYGDVLHQYGLELVIGADEHSHWMSDSLVIRNNQGPIHACQTAFYAVMVEMNRRGVDRPDGV